MAGAFGAGIGPESTRTRVSDKIRASRSNVAGGVAMGGAREGRALPLKRCTLMRAYVEHGLGVRHCTATDSSTTVTALMRIGCGAPSTQTSRTHPVEEDPWTCFRP